MALRKGTCNQCEKLVEFQTMPVASGVIYKCSNCWAVLTPAEMAAADVLTEKLAALDRQRENLLSAAPGPNGRSAKP